MQAIATVSENLAIDRNNFVKKVNVDRPKSNLDPREFSIHLISRWAIKS